MTSNVKSVFLAMLLIGAAAIAFNGERAWAVGTIYIRPDGSVDPETAPINRNGDIYTFASNIVENIVVQKDDIIIDGQGYKIQGPGSGSTALTIGFDLSSRKNVTVKNTRIEEWDYGVQISNLSSENLVINNNFTKNMLRAIFFSNSSDNTIQGNTIVDNGGDGIFLGLTNSTIVMENNVSRNGEDGIAIGYRSYNNAITGNAVYDNSWDGISLGWELSTGNQIIANNIVFNHRAGIYIANANGNVFYHNNILNNAQQVFLTFDVPNVWDAGYPSGGNYWNDHAKVDVFWGPYQNKIGSDGIIDSPYAIAGNNKDNYPLMSPYEYWSNPIPGDINKDMNVDNNDMYQLAVAYGSSPEKQNWNPNCDLAVDNMVTVSDLFRLGRNYGKTSP